MSAARPGQLRLACLSCVLAGALLSAGRAAIAISYRDLITGTASTLSASVTALNAESGAVTINGVDARRPSTPFQFEWGDGQRSQGFFPATHTYANRGGNYVVTVTATYPDGTTDANSVAVRLTTVALRGFQAPAEVEFVLPAVAPVLTSSEPGSGLPTTQPLSDAALAPLGRAVLERFLSACATIQQDLVNEDMRTTDGTFRQIAMALPETSDSFAFSVWYAQPVMLVGRPSFFAPDPDWTSMAHEMGHNFTLNSPAAFRLGGKIDGNANAIVSEALAQIFQHVTCHLLVNNAAFYGLPDELAVDIARRARASFATLKSRNASAPFASWNDPATAADEMLPTFMTVAYQFFAAGDLDGVRYRRATKRLMYFLQHFNAQWQTRFSARVNSPAAETFRATLMVAAVSFGVEQDLRPTFRGLGFPVDDPTYQELNATVGEFPHDGSRLVNVSVRSGAGTGDRTLTVGFAIGGRGAKQVLVRGIGPTLGAFGVGGALSDPQLRLSNSRAEPIGDNDDWGGGGFARGAFAAVGAFPLEANSRDAACVPTLRAGSYSAQITTTGGSGVALVEVYDLEGLEGTTRLANLSARTEVGSGDNTLVAGFVISGTAPKRLLVRAVGPGLTQFGVGGALADPQLAVFGDGVVVASNNDWSGATELREAFASVGAFALAAGSRDAAMVVTLPAGSYSAQVTGASGTTGVALVEIYELP